MLTLEYRKEIMAISDNHNEFHLVECPQRRLQIIIDSSNYYETEKHTFKFLHNN